MWWRVVSAFGAATANERAPQFVAVELMTRSPRTDTTGLHRSARYDDASLCSALNSAGTTWTGCAAEPEASRVLLGLLDGGCYYQCGPHWWKFYYLSLLVGQGNCYWLAEDRKQNGLHTVKDRLKTELIGVIASMKTEQETAHSAEHLKKTFQSLCIR